MSAAKRVCDRETVPLPMSFATYELAEDKAIPYEFVIKNFVATQSDLQPIVSSPTFPRITGFPQWCIIVGPRGDVNDETNKKYKFQAGVQLRMARMSKTSEVFAVKFRFLKDDRSVIMKRHSPSKDVVPGDAALVTFTTDSTVAIPVSDSGDLIVNVEIFLRGPKPIVVTETVNDTRIPKSTFSRAFSRALESGNLSDFTVISSDQREFRVHKIILAMRVPHFDRMFKSGLDEAKQSRVEVDFSGDCVEGLMEYVYRDGVAKLNGIAVELLKLAHQYEMDRLMSICVAEMVKNLGEENLCESLRIADLYSIVPLQSACHTFIARHPDVTAKAILQIGGSRS